jgi:hypothetical protein
MIRRIISKIRGGKKWPAQAWILKTWNNNLTIDKTDARRVDEIEDGEIAPEESKFELKGGHETNPIPYSAIHQTSDGPLVILKSPEKGTYIPYNLSDNHDDLELEKALDNQEWLRWARDTLRDLSLTWQSEEDFWDKHAGKITVILAAVLVTVAAILQYMMWGDLTEAINLLAETRAGQ